VTTRRRVLILADDLSGAADCGIAWAASGFDAAVALGPVRCDATADAEVLAVDLDSRRMEPQAARALIREAASGLIAPECRIVYKKIDSTLRGNVAAEIAGLCEAARAGGADDVLAIVAPAFPATGRTTLDGRVHVHDTPLEQTEMWRREGRGPDPGLIGLMSRAGMRATLLPLSAVRAGPSALARDLRARRAAGDAAVVCDAQTDEDLAAIAAAGVALDGIVWAGSAGLAHPLASRTIGGTGRPSSRNAAASLRRAGPIVVVAGSMSGIARAQVRVLAQDQAVAVVTMAPEVLRAGPRARDWRAAARDLDAALEDARRDTVVVAIAAGPDGDDDGTGLCAGLARLVAPYALRAGALVATGGETARAVLTALGATGLRLVGEIEPGVPLAVAPLAGRDLPVVTKAGAFGTPETLARALARLRAIPIITSQPAAQSNERGDGEDTWTPDP